MAKGVAKRTKEQIRKSSTKQLEAEGQLASRPFCTSQTNSVKKILKGKSQSRKKKTCQLSWDLQGIPDTGVTLQDFLVGCFSFGVSW